MFAWFIHEHRHVECNASVGVCQPQGLLGFFKFKATLECVFVVPDKGTVDNHFPPWCVLVEVGTNQRVVGLANAEIAALLPVVEALQGANETHLAISATGLIPMSQQIAMCVDAVIQIWSIGDVELDAIIAFERRFKHGIQQPVVGCFGFVLAYGLRGCP